MENKVSKKGPKHLDDDEDRKNPAYIPRKGLFFEHDLRGQTQEEESKFRACSCESEHLPAMGNLKCADRIDVRELKNLPK